MGKTNTEKLSPNLGHVAEDYTRVRGKRREATRNWTKGQRKRGVKREAREKKIEESTKILLTQNDDSHDTPDAPVTAFPSNVPTFLSYPHAGNTVSKEYRCRHN
jgi:hypothetical protein